MDMRSTLRTVGRLQTSEGSVTLRMSVGVHSGDFDCYLVGDPDVHRELLVVGPGVTTTAVMEQAASAGQVVVSPQTAACSPPRPRGGPAGDARLVHGRRPLVLAGGRDGGLRPHPDRPGARGLSAAGDPASADRRAR